MIKVTISAKESLSADDPAKIASTSDLKSATSTPSTLPLNSILPVMIRPLPNTTELPSEDRILLPAAICIGASNSILPLPEAVKVISPSTVCNVMVSEPSSNILIDSPLSVVTLNSVPVVESTCCPLIYNEPEDRYRSLHCLVGEPKSTVSVVSGIIETFVIRPALEIDAVAVVLDILAKFNPVTELAGIFVNLAPSPTKEPVNEPDKAAISSFVSSLSDNFNLPFETLSTFLLPDVPISISEATIFFNVLLPSLISTLPLVSFVILVPPKLIVLPAK